LRILSKTALALLSMGLAIAAPGFVDAQAAHGDFGAKSQASIRINVSVAPRFESPSALPRADPSEAPSGSIRFASNAPGLRYSVETYPAQPAPPELRSGTAAGASSETRQADRTRVLVLIVPE
jgi:hypothetical protein